MENWARLRVNFKMEHEPIHLTISQKIHWQPHLSFGFSRFKCTPIQQNVLLGGALMNWRRQSAFLPGFQGSASSVVTPMSRLAFVLSPLENRNFIALLNLATVCFAKTAVAPLERVKLLMQNQNAMIKSGRLTKPYNGILDCFARTIRNEGFFSLWRGNIAISMGHISSNVITFALLQSITSHKEVLQFSYNQMLALSCLLTAANQFLVYPLYYAGTRLATDVKTTSNLSKRQFNGILDVYRKTLRSDGIAGLYRGYNISLADDGLITVVSSALKKWQMSSILLFEDQLWAMVMVKHVFSVCSNMASYPLDTVSKRMMMTSGEAVRYKSSMNAFAQIFKTEGVKSFYKGAGAEIFKTIALNGYILLAIYLAGYIVAAAMEVKPGEDVNQTGSTVTIRWKNPRDRP